MKISSYRSTIENKANDRLGIAFEPWGNMVFLEKGESIVIEAYDYGEVSSNEDLFTLVIKQNEILIYATDNASVRVLKSGEELYNMTY